MNDEVEAALLAAGLCRRAHPHRTLRRAAIGGRRAPLHAPRKATPTTARITVVRDGLTREVGFQPGRRQHPRRRAARRHGRAVLLQVGRVRHLPRQAAAKARCAWTATSRSTRPTWRRLRAHLPVAPADRHGRASLRRPLGARPRAATYDDQREQILARAARALRPARLHRHHDERRGRGLRRDQADAVPLLHRQAEPAGTSRPATWSGWSSWSPRCRRGGWHPPPRLRTDRALHARLCRRAARTPRADRGREVPPETRNADAVLAARARVVAAFADTIARAAARPAAASAAQAADDAAVRHDQLDLHLAASWTVR
jgi:hypothetical protein